jgi:hypothetical protein
LFYTNYYGLAETSTGAFVLSVPARPGILAIGFVSSGFSAINESRASLAYARSIGKKLRVGAGINWLHFNQPYDYRDLYAWIPVLGIQCMPTNNWILGAVVINPGGQQYLPRGYRSIASGITAGLGFKPSEEFQLLLEVQKLSGEIPRYVLGFEFSLLKSFFIRYGISSQYGFSYFAGIGYMNKKITLNTSFSHHPVLGFSPALDFNFKF